MSTIYLTRTQARCIVNVKTSGWFALHWMVWLCTASHRSAARLQEQYTDGQDALTPGSIPGFAPFPRDRGLFPNCAIQLSIQRYRGLVPNCAIQLLISTPICTNGDHRQQRGGSFAQILHKSCAYRAYLFRLSSRLCRCTTICILLVLLPWNIFHRPHKSQRINCYFSQSGLQDIPGILAKSENIKKNSGRSCRCSLVSSFWPFCSFVSCCCWRWCRQWHQSTQPPQQCSCPVHRYCNSSSSRLQYWEKQLELRNYAKGKVLNFS